MPATAIATSPHPVIELHGVTRVYGEGEHAVHALRGVDLAIGAREFVAIMGASGSATACCTTPTRCPGASSNASRSPARS